MSDAATPLPASPHQRQLDRLDALAELGLVCAKAVADQAQTEAPDVAEIALAYSRVSRAVRLTIALHAKLMQDGKASEREDAKTRAAEAVAAKEAAELEARSGPLYVRKARVEQIVERLAEAEHPDDEDAVDLIVIEAGERLDDETLYGDLMDTPFDEIVDRICADLGLNAASPARGGGGPRSGGEGMVSHSPMQEGMDQEQRLPPALSVSFADISPASGRDRMGHDPPTPATPAPWPD
jgi:hypothetical protein